MRVFSDIAYGAYLGSLPMIAVIGLLTYIGLLTTAILASGKKWSRRLRRVPVKAHRALAGLTLVLATLHLLMGISLYV